MANQTKTTVLLYPDMETRTRMTLGKTEGKYGPIIKHGDKVFIRLCRKGLDDNCMVFTAYAARIDDTRDNGLYRLQWLNHMQAIEPDDRAELQNTLWDVERSTVVTLDNIFDYF